jgi:MFS family permease
LNPTDPNAPASGPELRHAYWFSVFNALSWQVVLGGPMVLYAKSLGATATVLGIVAGMMPLLTIAQIPAANFIDRIGYRRFVLGGWSARLVFVFFMAMVPLAGGFLGAGSQLAVLLTLLFCFNLLRGISGSAWLPWITGLVPLEFRGRYLARDQASSNSGSFLCFLSTGLLLGAGVLLPAPPRPWQFSLTFLFSGIMGAMSLLFLKRMPDTPVPPDESGGKGPVPWLAIASHPPFRKLLELNAVWSLAYGGLTTFIVAFLKTGADLRDGQILMLMSVQFLGGLGALWFGGRRLDLHGSKPAFGFIMLTGMLVASGWFLMSARVVIPAGWAVLLLIVPLGLLNALFSAANNRFAMAIVPRMGRNHFFALFTVVWQVTLGLSPVLWGLLIDLIGDGGGRLLGADWNRYSIFFFLVAITFIAAFVVSRRLEEPKAASVETLLRELFLHEPHRVFARLFGRGN